MSVLDWTASGTAKAREIWADYQRRHDVSDRLGQTVGIDPDTGRIWFGDTISDVVAQRDNDGVDSPDAACRK